MKSKIFILCLCFFCINSVTSQSYTPTTTVETPFRSIVKDTGIFTSQDDIYSSSELAYYKKILNDNYNGATMIDIPTRTYNCHAYAWHVSEGGNKVWIGLNPGTKAEHVYWTDGSYIEVSESGSTKVSYHESGNHSAIRLGNGWYQSKWGRGPLVKHHLNDVPLGYNPNMPKKFYKKRDISIIGQTFICSFEDYSVSYLPSGATVNWTYTPVYSSNTPSIQQNTPSANSCTVKNTYSQFFEGYLNAEIKISGKIVKKYLRL